MKPFWVYTHALHVVPGLVDVVFIAVNDAEEREGRRHILHTKHYIIRNICKVSLWFGALYAKCPYYLVLYM